MRIIYTVQRLTCKPVFESLCPILYLFFFRKKITKRNSSMYKCIRAIPIILLSTNRKLVNCIYNFFMAAALEYYYAIEGHSAVKEYKKKKWTSTYSYGDDWGIRRQVHFMLLLYRITFGCQIINKYYYNLSRSQLEFGCQRSLI